MSHRTDALHEGTHVGNDIGHKKVPKRGRAQRPP